MKKSIPKISMLVNIAISYLNKGPKNQEQVLAFVCCWLPEFLPKYTYNFLYLNPDLPTKSALRELINGEIVYFDNDAYYEDLYELVRRDYARFCEDGSLPMDEITEVLKHRPSVLYKDKIRPSLNRKSGEWLRIILYSILVKLNNSDLKERVHCCPQCQSFFIGRPNQKFCKNEHTEIYHKRRLAKAHYHRDWLRNRRKWDSDYITNYFDYRQ